MLKFIDHLRVIKYIYIIINMLIHKKQKCFCQYLSHTLNDTWLILIRQLHTSKSKVKIIISKKIGLTFFENEIWWAGVFSREKIGVVSLEIGFFSEQWTPAYTAKALDQVIVWTWESQTKKFSEQQTQQPQWELLRVSNGKNSSKCLEVP